MHLHTATMSAEETEAAALALAEESDMRCGRVCDAPGRENDQDAIDLARFAVDAHN